MNGKEKLRTSPSTASCLGKNILDCVLNEEQGPNVNRRYSSKNNLIKNDVRVYTASSHCHYCNNVVTPCGQVNDLENILSNQIDTGNRELQLSYVCGSVHDKQKKYAQIATAEELHIPGWYNTSVINDDSVMFCNNIS